MSRISSTLERLYGARISKYLIFFLVIGTLSLIYNMDETIKDRPTSMHQWRNCVSASIALNYYHQGEFFYPRTHNMQADEHTSDISITEFPIIYYTVGMLYRLFGFNEIIYRLVNILIGWTGLFFLFLLGRRIFKNSLYAMVLPVILYTSPIFVYYINNFIPDAVSLATASISLYYFYRYREEGVFKHFILSMVFSALAGLLKTPALILFFAIGGMFVLERIIGIRMDRQDKIFPHWPRIVMTFTGVVLILVAWYGYAKIYTDHHWTLVSPVEIRPIWRLSGETIQQTLEAVKNRFLKGQYHSPVFILVALALLIHNLVQWKKYDRFLSILLLLTIFGGFSFSMLFFRSLKQHDYYQMNNLILLVMACINFYLYLKEHRPGIFSSWVTKTITVALLVFMVVSSSQTLSKLYYHGWHMKYAMETYNNRYDEITPYLRSLGIERTDKVYVTPDNSINISLYLMDQKGFTDFNKNSFTFSEHVNYLKQYDLKYVLVGDAEKLDADPLALGLKEIGQYNGVVIYRLL